jgi:hypothetical protein
MRILIKPSDIVKRCLWDYYVYYIIGSEKEAEKLLQEDQEFELSERDAIVIGFLKVMETDNLIHKFNDHMVHFLTSKSIKESEQALIRKRSVEIAVDKFLDKFPDYWTPPVNYLNGLKDLIDYIEKFKEKTSELDIIKATIQNVTYEFYPANSVKKLLYFNHY